MTIFFFFFGLSWTICLQLLLETVCSTVVFQYVPEDMKEGKNSEYYDNLNSWVSIGLPLSQGT